MAQFDVHENRGPNRPTRPFVVLLQSARFDNYDRRLVAPLARLSVSPIPASEVTPHLLIGNERFALLTLELVSIERTRLGAHVASLAADSVRIITAIDEVITAAYN